MPGIDDQAILDQIVPIAEEWVLMKIVESHLSSDDQALFRDAYLSAPDVFDAVEFLSDSIVNLDSLLEQYGTMWFDNFNKNLNNK